MDGQQERIRGAEARQALENKYIAEAFAVVESNIVKRMKQGVDEKEAIRLQLMLQMLGKVHQYLLQVIDTGKMAELSEQEKARISWMERARASLVR